MLHGPPCGMVFGVSGLGFGVDASWLAWDAYVVVIPTHGLSLDVLHCHQQLPHGSACNMALGVNMRVL
jgi:hypothetical protein